MAGIRWGKSRMADKGENTSKSKKIRGLIFLLLVIVAGAVVVNESILPIFGDKSSRNSGKLKYARYIIRKGCDISQAQQSSSTKEAFEA